MVNNTSLSITNIIFDTGGPTKHEYTSSYALHYKPVNAPFTFLYHGNIALGCGISHNIQQCINKYILYYLSYHMECLMPLHMSGLVPGRGTGD